MISPGEAFDIHESEVRSLVDSYRTQCLWFLREDFYPENDEEAVRVLHQIERNADLEGFRRAARLRAWALTDFQRTGAVCSSLPGGSLSAGEALVEISGPWPPRR
jgi:hypothetical protein